MEMTRRSSLSNHSIFRETRWTHEGRQERCSARIEGIEVRLAVVNIPHLDAVSRIEEI